MTKKQNSAVNIAAHLLLHIYGDYPEMVQAIKESYDECKSLDDTSDFVGALTKVRKHIDGLINELKGDAMNADMSYCKGQEPYEKCKTCKRFIKNRPAHTLIWMVEPCEYVNKFTEDKQ